MTLILQRFNSGDADKSNLFLSQAEVALAATFETMC